MSANNVARPNQVVIVSTKDELKREADISRELQLTFLQKWTDTQRHTLKYSMFSIPPSTIEPIALTWEDVRVLKKRFDGKENVQKILRKSNLQLLFLPRLQPITFYNAMDLLLDSQKLFGQFYTLEFAKEVIGWMLTNVIVSCSLLEQNEIVHADVKLNNLLYDPRVKQFKLGDFGLSKTYRTCNFASQFGKTMYPWHHPIFLAIQCMAPQNPRKALLGRKHASLVDRYAFVGLLYQLSCAIPNSKKLGHSIQLELRDSLFSLCGMCRKPVSTHRPTNTQEFQAQRLEQDFHRKSMEWLEKMKLRFDHRKEHGASDFVQLVLDMEVWDVAEWSYIFDSVVLWAWRKSRRPKHMESLAQFIESKRRTYKRKRKLI